MNGTAKILYCPPGRTDEILLYHIRDFADLADTSRREVDRRIADGEIEKVRIHGITCIPAEYLNRFHRKDIGGGPKRGEQPTGGPSASAEAETEHRAEAAPATPWEELTYEPR